MNASYGVIAQISTEHLLCADSGPWCEEEEIENEKRYRHESANDMAALEDCWQFLSKQNILLSYNPTIVHLGIYPKALKTCVHPKTCTLMLIAALFTD